ncbi:MAG: cytochrome P450 [Acidimicrobiaceae bacterium]|nr:cytochrome P450 [Acidimicrobiaceae bacterium]MCO5330575.1 cytochrome P450 [Ilumatobacteraceae bacterium]
MAARQDTLPHLDILSHDVYEAGVPHAAYDEFRRTAPVAWVNETDKGHHGRGFWSLTCHEDVVAVHKDWRTFSSEVDGTEIEELEPDALAARRTMLETDPPRHTKLRQLVNPTFSKMAVETYAAHAERLVGEVLDRAIGRDADGVYDIARDLPIRMITGLLGVPEEDAPQLFHWADQIVYNADPDYSPLISDHGDTDPYRLLPFRSPVSLTVLEYVHRLAVARRGVDGGDLLTVLSNALVDGEPLPEREQGTFFLLLLIAGNETTRHSLSQGLLALAEHPDQLARLAADPSLLDSATEEVLRWTSPQLHFRRTATVATEIGGVPVAAGDKVVTWYLAANFDPEVFPDPHRFDLGRSPNRHVTFGGGGPHLCLGQWMARLEVRTFLAALAQRVRRVELTGDPKRVRSNFINGLKALPLHLVPR